MQFLCRRLTRSELSLRKVDLKVAHRLNYRQRDPPEVGYLVYLARDNRSTQPGVWCDWEWKERDTTDIPKFWTVFMVNIPFFFIWPVHSKWPVKFVKVRLFWIKSFLINASYLEKWDINVPRSKMTPHSLVPV